MCLSVQFHRQGAVLLSHGRKSRDALAARLSSKPVFASGSAERGELRHPIIVVSSSILVIVIIVKAVPSPRRRSRTTSCTCSPPARATCLRTAHSGGVWRRATCFDVLYVVVEFVVVCVSSKRNENYASTSMYHHKRYLYRTSCDTNLRTRTCPGLFVEHSRYV